MSERDNLTTSDLVRGDRDEPDEVDLDQEERQPLLPGEATADFRGRWESIQIGFVDEPRGSVEQADNLVAEADAATRPHVLGRADAARVAVGPRRRGVDGGAPRGAATLPLVLRPPALDLRRQ